MHYLIFFAMLAPAFAADFTPNEAFFLLVGGTDKQLAACPSPVEVKKGSFASGAFLQSTYPGQKIEVEKPVGNRHRFLVNQRAIEITVASPAELHWDERSVAKDFKGTLCQRAIYTTNSVSQEEIDSMVKEEETMSDVESAKKSEAPKTKAKIPKNKSGK